MSISQAIGSRAALGMQVHAKAIRDAVEPQQARDFFKEVGLNYIISAYSSQQVMFGCILRFHEGHTSDLAYYPSTSTYFSPPPNSSPHPLFKTQVCRCLPTILKMYNIQELTTVPKLRSHIATMFRQNAQVKSPEAINLLIFKGGEELEMIIKRHKQRHHIIDRYIHNPAADKVDKPTGMSKFLEDFYRSNY
jgi:NADH dehydrogenase (ubiquinone) 1 alpha subcomplex subunit 6